MKTASFKDYIISIDNGGSVKVSKDGTLCGNTKAALREIAAEINYGVDPKWNTQQFGAKLVNALNDNKPKGKEINISPNKKIREIYSEFTLIYPRLHLRFLTEPGRINKMVDIEGTVKSTRSTNYTKESGVIDLSDNQTCRDFCNQFDEYGLDAWICGTGNDGTVEPYGWDYTLKMSDRTGLKFGDLKYVIADSSKLEVPIEKPKDIAESIIDSVKKLAYKLKEYDDSEEAEYETEGIIGEDYDEDAIIYAFAEHFDKTEDELSSSIIDDYDEEDIEDALAFLFDNCTSFEVSFLNVVDPKTGKVWH